MRAAWRWGQLFVNRFNAARVPILAASLAYYATLSLFPLLLLAFAGFGFALERYPGLKDEILRFLSLAVQQAFPASVVKAAFLTGQGEVIEVGPDA